MSEELVTAVLELTIDAADHEARQHAEVEADMANVLQWMSGIGACARRAHNAFDAITLDLLV